MAAPSYASEPQIQYLHQVLEAIHRGELQIPDFHRPPRWRDDQRKRLMESVSQGTPIGSLMVWRTSLEIAPKTRFGYVNLPEQSSGTSRQYLLDGFQRMSTLYAALYASEDTPTSADENGCRWLLGYHLEKGEWVFLNDLPDDERPLVLPGRLLLRGREVLRFQRGLQHPEVDRLVDACDGVVEAFKQYKLPTIPIVTDAVDVVTRTYVLLNSEGTEVSDLDLVAALTWRENYRLRDHLEDASQRLGQVGWEGLGARYLLAALRAGLNMDIYEGRAMDLAENLARAPQELDRVVDGLIAAAGHLREEGVVSLDLLPYSYQAVLIGEVLRSQPEPSPELKTALRRWFWWTTAWGTFAGISRYRMVAMVSYMRDLAAGRPVRWPLERPVPPPSPYPSSFDPRGAQTRLLTLLLLKRRQDPTAVLVRLREQGAKALIRGLFGLEASAARAPGNAFLVSVDEEPGFIKALAARRDGTTGHDHAMFTDEAARAEHLISDAAWQLLGGGDVAGFVGQRTRDLEVWKGQFLEQIGRPPGCEG